MSGDRWELVDMAASQVDHNVRKNGENWWTLLPAKWRLMSGDR